MPDQSLPFILFGAGGHAKVVLDALELCSEVPDLVLDDQPKVSHIMGHPVSRNEPGIWETHRRFRFHVAIGHNKTRGRIYDLCLSRGGVPLSVIHPTAILSRHASIGDGTFVAAGAVINPYAEIGPNVIINTGATIDHDCTIGAHVHVCPGVSLAGEVRIGSFTMIGTGTSIIPGILIGENVIIGAGSVVVRPIPPGTKSYGVPARVCAAN